MGNGEYLRTYTLHLASLDWAACGSSEGNAGHESEDNSGGTHLHWLVGLELVTLEEEG